MNGFRYPRAALFTDALRGVLGASACAAVYLTAPPQGWLRMVMLALLVVFVWWLLQVLARARCRFECDPQALRVYRNASSSTARTVVAWHELSRLDVDYFSTRRDGSAGWLQLRLRSGRHKVRLDSRLSGFESVLEQAVNVAVQRGVPLSATTTANLLALGVLDERALAATATTAAPAVQRPAGGVPNADDGRVAESLQPPAPSRAHGGLR